MSAAAPGAGTFSPQAYADLIAGVRARGYQARLFADADPAVRHVIFRHDVDFSLAAALAMAEAEKELGVVSTYFLLLRTEFYNLLSDKALAAAKRILDCGHHIGLHFDAALYPEDSAQVEAAAASECGLLEAALGRPVETISFHRPDRGLIGQSERISGRLNAYGPRFVRDMGYCSDSQGAWHHGAPFDHPAVQQGRALQLLVHPFWWQTPALPPQERLQRFLAERGRFLDQELARHCTIHCAGGGV